MRCFDVKLTACMLALPAALCAAQAGVNNGVNPRALLEEIVAAGRGAPAWRAQGVETGELTGEGMNLHTEIHFQADFRDPSHVRWETTGDTRSLTVCDGADRWTWAEPGTGFYRNPVDPGQCRSELPDFDDLLDNLVAVTAASSDQVPFEGAPRDCDNLRAEYRIPAPTSASGAAGTTIIRTICIDSARKMILRDRMESWATGSNTRSTRTIAFHSYERGVDIPDAAFRFEVPTGTFLDPGPQIAEDDAGAETGGAENADARSGRGTYRAGNGVSRPQLINKAEPSWTEEEIKAGISGLVLISLTVDAEGNPRDLTVARGLSRGLDEKALAAVRQWRFSPGLRNGMPVAVGNLTVAVDFRLP